MSSRSAIVLSALASLCFAQRATATPPRPPASLSVSKEELRGVLQGAKGKLEVKVMVEAHEPVKQLRLSASITLDVNPLLQRAPRVRLLDTVVAARSEGQSEHVVPIKIPGPGRYELDIRLSGRTAAGSGFSDRVIRHVIVDDKGTYRIVAANVTQAEAGAARMARFKAQTEADPKHPDIRLLFGSTARVADGVVRRIKDWSLPPEHRLQARPLGPSGIVTKYIVTKAPNGKPVTDPITVRGRLVFSDPGNNVRPVVNASVNVWDDDTFGDENLGVTITDWNGNWSLVVDADDGWLQDGRDIYYSFALENTELRTKACGTSDAYEWTSAVHDDLPDGTVLDFGTETGVESPNSMQIWSVLNLAWNHATAVGAQDPGFIDSCFPDGGGTFTSGAEVHVLAGDNDGPDSITHEYGHAIMERAYAASGGNPSPGGGHGFGDCNQNNSLSWSEGWATGFMLSARPDGIYNWHEGQPGQAIEAFGSTCHTGEGSEGWVAAALLDMLDRTDDDNGGSLDRGRDKHSDANARSPIALASILRDTLWGSHHDTVLDFWNSLSAELDTTRRTQGQEIMYYDWMTVLDPNACAATTIAAHAFKDSDALLQGLRHFRDLALRNVGDGRQLINTYYRNSPELGLLLLQNPQASAEALRVMQFFSELGDAAAHHEKYVQLPRRPQPFIPAEVQRSIAAIFALLEQRGSPELKKDLAAVRSAYAAVKDRSFDQLDQYANELRAKAAGAKPIGLRPSALNPASQKALTQPELKKALAPALQAR